MNSKEMRQAAEKLHSPFISKERMQFGGLVYFLVYMFLFRRRQQSVNSYAKT